MKQIIFFSAFTTMVIIIIIPMIIIVIVIIELIASIWIFHSPYDCQAQVLLLFNSHIQH